MSLLLRVQPMNFYRFAFFLRYLNQLHNVSPPIPLGPVTNHLVQEASGLVLSNSILWTINDSLNDTYGPTDIFAMDTNGSFLGHIHLNNVNNYDWEAISKAPCFPNSYERCLFIGDVGDNERDRSYITVYKVKEPSRKDLQKSPNSILYLSPLATIHYRYPDEAQDCEAFLIDSKTREIFFITKTKLGTRVYKGSLDSSISKRLIRVFVDLPIIIVTDASSSNDGSIIIRSYYYCIYISSSHYGIEITLKVGTKNEAPLIRQRQGESIALSEDGKSYYIHSEGLNQTLYKYDFIKYV